MKWCTSKVCLVGKTIIVTGANTGIGYEAALEFAKRGARVILACRDETRATQARDKIIKETENKNVVVKLVDFSSLKSVRDFAKDIVETEERVDVLVNNAGIADVGEKLTDDGLDFLMQVNHFGPFLLTLLLIGIGYATALEFAKRDARVILACRDETRATQARDKIIKETENRNVLVKLVDFSSLKSVRDFAKDIVETEKRLDILVNNAAITGVGEKVTEDGLDLLMQVNHFGPFLLTLLLIDKLKQSAPSRIVVVADLLAAYAKLNVDKLDKYPGSLRAYNNTKLCNILFTMHLAKLLDKDNVTAYSVHPGGVVTEISRNYGGLKKCGLAIVKPFLKTAEEGAQTVIYTAIEQGIEQYSGRHFDECQVVNTYKTARDPDLPKKLWDKSIEILKCEEEAKNV